MVITNFKKNHSRFFCVAATFFCFSLITSCKNTSTPPEPEDLIKTVVFTEAQGSYDGVSESGLSGRFTITLSNNKGEKLIITAFDDLFAIPSKFIPRNGDYTLGNDSSPMTFAAGKRDGDNSSGTWFDSQAISGGKFTVSGSEDQIALSGKFNGTTDEGKKAEITVSYSGPLTFMSDVELSYMEYNDTPQVLYYGDHKTNDGLGRFDIVFNSDFIPEVEIAQFHSFYSPYLFAPLVKDPHINNIPFPEGIFRINAEDAIGSMRPGSTVKEGDKVRLQGTRYQLVAISVATDVILAENGTMIVRRYENNYEIYAHFAGHDMTGNIRDFAIKRTGSIPIVNKVPSKSYEFDVNTADLNYRKDNTPQNMLTLKSSFTSSSIFELEIDLNLPVSDSPAMLPLGEYTLSQSADDYRTFFPGSNDPTGLTGSKLMIYSQMGAMEDVFLVEDGSFNISKGSADDLYNIEGAFSTIRHRDGMTSEVKFRMEDKTIRIDDKSQY